MSPKVSSQPLPVSLADSHDALAQTQRCSPSVRSEGKVMQHTICTKLYGLHQECTAELASEVLNF